MTVTRASFRANYPVYDNTSDALVDARLADAQLEVGTPWGTFQDAATMLLTAHLLAIDPLGESAARSSAANGADNYGSSTYLKAFERMRATARGGFFGAVGG